jgi:transposase InsO family protein
MGEHRSRITRTNGMTPWRAGCGESCTSGSEGGLGKPVGGDSGTAPQSDPYTEHPTREGKLYCAVVLDACSRKVVGWSIDSNQETSLVINALGMAIQNREPTDQTVIHSDQGTQFTSWAFTQRVLDAGLLPSMGSVGDCYDNAKMESFWSRVQVELLDRKRWNTRVELATALFEYLEIFHNRQRRHSSLGMLTPVEFEARLRPTSAARNQAI